MAKIAQVNLKPGQVFITPEMAKDFWTKNITNRNIRKHKVDEIAYDMLEGRYNSNNPNAGLVFDTDDELMDGQHRVAAIMRAHQLDGDFPGIVMFVYRNVEKAVRDVMDIGSPRTAADILGMKGHKTAATVVTAAAKIVLNYMEGQKLNASRSKAECVKFAEDHPELIGIGAAAASARGQGRKPSVLAAVAFLGTRFRDAGADEGELHDHAIRFLEGVANGAELQLTDPRLVLRNTLFQAQNSTDKRRMSYAMGAAASAWNNYIAGLDTQQLRVVQEDTGEYAIQPILGGPEQGAGVSEVDHGNLPPKARLLAKEQRKRWQSQAATVAAE